MKTAVSLLLGIVVGAGCAQSGRPMQPRESKSPLPMPWKRLHHPTAKGGFSIATGQMDYKTGGTVIDRREDVDAQLYRFGIEERGGFTIDFVDGNGGLGGSDADVRQFDIFGFGVIPVEPSRRFRFVSRPGFFFDSFDLRGARTADVETWYWGLRYEGEAEFDIIKRPRLIFTGFVSGRLGYGWGNADVRSFGDEFVTALDYGFEAGLRVHIQRFFVAASWLQRTSEINGDFHFDRADYAFAGGNITVGLRW